jgi:hypothetical protein
MPVITIPSSGLSGGTFTEYSQDQFCIELAQRLYDPLEQFWSRAEKRLLIAEALRIWNALTGYWRGEFTFGLQQGVIYYDLTDQTAMPSTLRPRTLLDTDIYSRIQYHLLEPQGMNPWTGSLQFAAADLVSAVQRRRDEILSVTGCYVTKTLIPAIAGRILLPENTLDVRRVAYLPLAITNQLPSAMFIEDVWAEQSFNVGWTQQPPGTPTMAFLSTQPPLSFDVDVAPAYGGNYETLLVLAGQPLSATLASSLSGIPDDYAWVLKWGALADLLSREGQAKDELRAAYCNQMYRMGLGILSSAPAILSLRLNNLPLPVDSIHSLDLYSTSWQGQTQSQPQQVGIGGLNLMAFSPPPDAGVYTITASVVQNAPIPADDAKNIQAGYDEVDVLLDYCVHAAMFKCGGVEFSNTTSLLERFLKAAQTYNRKLNSIAEYRSFLQSLSQSQEQSEPRMTPDTEEVNG